MAVSALAALSLPGQSSSAAPSSVGNGRIAYSHLGADGNHSQIYTTTAAGIHRRHLTASRKYSSLSPKYSPSGKRIVFVRAFRQSDLWEMHADGRHKGRLTSTPGIDEIEPAWSPDASEIAFRVDAPTALQGIWVIGVDGENRRRLTNGNDRNPSWSPDGSEIAFSRYDASTQIDSIYVVPAGGGTPTDLSDDSGVSDSQPAWSPDGSRILFTSDRPDTFQLDLWTMNPEGGNVRRVTNTPDRDEHDPAWSPNGRTIVYAGESSSHGASSYQLYVSNANGSDRRIITHACGECAILNDDPSWQPLRR